MSSEILRIPVFILHWNRPEECLRAVDAYLAQDFPIQVTVIDNASEPSSLRSLRDRLPSQVELICLPENLGWGGAFNLPLAKWVKAQQGQYCFVSAHDALPDPNCLRMLVDSMRGDSNKVGISSAEVGVAHLAKFSPILGARLRYVTPRAPGTVESVPFPHGTLMLFKRQCLEEIGLFDDRYFAYGDETEIGLRAWRHGWKVVVVWGARVVNPGTWTPSRTRSYLFTRNSLLMAQTYGGWFRAVLRAAFIVPNTLRLFVTPSAQGSAFSPMARAAAIRDFLLGRYGPPPAEFRK